MDVKKAAEDLSEFIFEQSNGSEYFGNKEHIKSLLDGNLSYYYGDIDHLIGMCRKIESGEVAGEKAHRWIGWIQGCLYMRGEASLDEMKELNKKA